MGTIETDVVRIAERRLRLVTDDEAQRLGLTPRAIRRLVHLGRLHRVADGVLSIDSGALAVAQRELAICLTTPNAVLSHASAAAYWGLRRAIKDRVEVTVPHRRRVVDRSAVVHYSNRMPEHHVVELLDGSRVTSVARTLFDLGGVLDEPGHRSVIEDARNKRLCTDDEIGEVYADLCGRGRRGSAAWQRVADLAERRGRPTMSELELVLHDALVAAGLVGAVQQHELVLPSGRVVHLDLAFPVERVDLEVDHSEWHATDSSVESDKVRDLGLATMGCERLRFSERMLEHRLPMCIDVVRSVLTRRRTDLPPTG